MLATSAWELARLNLTSPAVLAFVLGVVAAVVRSDLAFPPAITSALSSYLLFALGLKGGVQLREVAVGDVAGPILATIVLGVATPLIAYALARRFLRTEIADSASLAAHFGSVSAVTFTAAETFTRDAGTLEEGFMPALVALLEIPGIVVALLLAARFLGNTSVRHAMREVVTGKSVVLLVGGLVIGGVADEGGVTKIEPLFVGLFTGVLVLFLLDLGTVAGQRLASLRQAGPRLVIFAIALPLLFGSMGAAAGTLSGLSVGGATVLATMAASASYIAAPAAVRAGLPQADPALSLGAALGVTFPFNLIIGIPLYAELAQLMG
ncbi:MAG: sodium-dependent bicarbonate transport family permease [Actinobacteria bacterium]|uniref:Unannotated protein n=1 Tax=freshwater metagenome TaxID=449393 RepID=A0A6J6GEC3_9ZZZZ|nr:sodium-dependent bicarbonate transport family permease [Actinomycetota bacterium]